MIPAHRLSAALALAALLSLALGVARSLPPSERLLAILPEALRPPVAPSAAARPASRTDRMVESLQLRLRARPDDQKAYAQLGAAYLQKARESGDPAYYPLAEAALSRALELQPADFDAVAAMGALLLARHQFEAALAWGRQAQARYPHRAALYGVVGDALVELGRYDEAVAAFQRMVDLRPDLNSYARVSYARELYGDVEGAIEAMRLAVSAGAPGSEPVAWALVQLGHLYWTTGNLPAADAAYRRALSMYPSYWPATAALGRVRAAEGRYADAVALLAPVAQVMPLPEYAILLGDVYRAMGDQAAAAGQYDLVRAIARLQRANGVDLDLEMALFEADHAQDAPALQAAVTQAQVAYARRPSIHAADALAWALYRAGQAENALFHAWEALRLGTRDPTLLFHAGAIAAAAGQLDEARAYLQAALALNPRFSVRYAPEAQRILAELKGVAQ
jgi:tetratricopeptide (TPR) repeat protein